MKTLEHLKEIGLVDQDKEKFTIIKEDGTEFDLVQVIDNFFEQKSKDVELRNLADIENLKKQFNKRIDSIKADERRKSVESLIELDNDVSLAMKMMSQEDQKKVKPFNEKLTSILQKNNIEEIQTDVYDPDLHEVVHIAESDKDGIEVVSKGYKIEDRILKHPKIVLIKKVK